MDLRNRGRTRQNLHPPDKPRYAGLTEAILASNERVCGQAAVF